MKPPATHKLYEIVRIKTQRQCGKGYGLNTPEDANKMLLQMQASYEKIDAKD